MPRSVALALLLLTLGGAAAAQQSPKQSPGRAPSSQPACAPGTDAPTIGSGQSGNLSDKLANSNGVICPPAGVDPQMHMAPPQEGGRMPVIPPPGAPGGDQRSIPK